MIEDAKNHLLHYAILITILVVGFGSIVLFSSNKQIQLSLAVITAISYVLWGITHHYMEDDMSVKVVVEYILIAMLSILILFSVLMRE